ncbi:MAG: hypothetical protein AB1599_06590 [Planctomycetota bacterium]
MKTEVTKTMKLRKVSGLLMALLIIEIKKAIMPQMMVGINTKRVIRNKSYNDPW